MQMSYKHLQYKIFEVCHWFQFWLSSFLCFSRELNSTNLNETEIGQIDFLQFIRNF